MAVDYSERRPLDTADRRTRQANAAQDERENDLEQMRAARITHVKELQKAMGVKGGLLPKPDDIKSMSREDLSSLDQRIDKIHADPASMGLIRPPALPDYKSTAPSTQATSGNYVPRGTPAANAVGQIDKSTGTPIVASVKAVGGPADGKTNTGGTQMATGENIGNNTKPAVTPASGAGPQAPTSSVNPATGIAYTPLERAMLDVPMPNGSAIAGIKQTGAGMVQILPNGREIAIQPSLDQLMHARTGGQWQGMNQQAKHDYLVGQVSPTAPAATPGAVTAPTDGHPTNTQTPFGTVAAQTGADYQKSLADTRAFATGGAPSVNNPLLATTPELSTPDLASGTAGKDPFSGIATATVAAPGSAPQAAPAATPAPYVNPSGGTNAQIAPGGMPAGAVNANSLPFQAGQLVGKAVGDTKSLVGDVAGAVGNSLSKGYADTKALVGSGIDATKTAFQGFNAGTSTASPTIPAVVPPLPKPDDTLKVATQ